MWTSLEQVAEAVKNCRKCSLWESRTQGVVGVGSPDAEIVFVGEAPGFHEDRQGEPFVGAAGRLLNELLASIGLERGSTYITNILKSRPPGNRDPLPDEIDACRPYLDAQLAIIKPRLLVSLGAFAARVLLGKKTVAMKTVHGRAFKVGSHIVFPIYHPAAALRASSSRTTLENDFKELRRFLDRPPEPTQDEPTQPALF